MKPYSFLVMSTLLVGLSLIVGGCSKYESTYDLSGNWRVIYYLDHGKKVVKTKDNTWLDINNGDITASFSKPDASGKGSITGIIVTNRYTGTYTIRDNGEITIGPIATTFIAQPEWTDLFKISIVERYEVKHSKLRIYYNDGDNVIVLVRD